MYNSLNTLIHTMGELGELCICELHLNKGRNINNLRYADDTTLMAESEEELKSLLKVKRE